jgi:prepilin-type N-terminal cleavage/methylation domain-containing protein
MKTISKKLRRSAFTLVELLLALTITAVVVAGVAMMAWTLTDYHYTGEAAVKLATQGRFGLMSLRRDVRAAQAVALTPAGSLAVWFGDLNQTGAIDLTQLAFYYYNASDRSLRRLTYSAAAADRYNFGPPSPAAFTASFADFDSGSYLASGSGLVVSNQIVCHNVDAVLFAANHVAGQADTVEFFLQMSSPENIVNSTGRPVNLNLYGSATPRAPTYAYGFAPQS